MRYFGPLSVKRADGAPECRFHESASALASGGLSVPFELCKGRGKSPCPHRSSCGAVDGVEGAEDAVFAVGPHTLLDSLDAFAGKSGLLLIDEPPDFLHAFELTRADFETTRVKLDSFDYRYSASLAPVLDALTRWFDSAPLDEPCRVDAVIAGGVRSDLEEAALSATGATDVTGAVRAAFPDGHKGPTSPPVRPSDMHQALNIPALARSIGTASRVLGMLRLGIVEPDQVLLRVEERKGARVLVVTQTIEALRRSARRMGQVVVLDANADMHKPIFDKLAGYDTRITEASAPDPVPVTRVHIRTRATRKAWVEDGKLVIDARVIRAIEEAVNNVVEYGAERVAFVTIRKLELAMMAAVGLDVTGEWTSQEQSAEDLEAARSKLGPVLARLRRRPDFGHYGAIRGLDKWKRHDALVTLVDPWPRLADVRVEVELFQLATDVEDRALVKCRAELEQAHGRLRIPRRERPCLLVHVGNVRPSGWHDNVKQVILEGRPGNPEQESQAETLRRLVEKHGSQKAAALAIGVSPMSFGRYLAGRGVPDDVWNRCQEELAE